MVSTKPRPNKFVARPLTRIQVLFKRKPVRFLPPADIQDDNAEVVLAHDGIDTFTEDSRRAQVWHIPETGEIFAKYEDYLHRFVSPIFPTFVDRVTYTRHSMDFYKQRRFNDQITGHSGLTFFEAFKSELTGGREVEASFPEALKGPILRKVQFQIISRLDNLVDLVFDEFKHDYYPGEEVTITINGGERAHGLVRDKTSFGPRVLPDGTQSLPMTRYHVTLKGSGEEAMVTDEDICRDRGVFTKAILRSFIKKTVVREAWNGAPWLVKADYASQYHIDTMIPSHLRHDTKLQERKQIQAQKRAQHSHGEVNGHSPSVQMGPMRLPELKPAPKGQKGKMGQPGPAQKGLKWPLSMAVHGSSPSNYSSLPYHDQKPIVREPSPPPPPPPPKYPIEDLQLEPRSDIVRPKLKFLCRNPPAGVKECDPEYEKIDMETVGLLLETWDTLNVYCEIFKLDSFTFDDYVQTMLVASDRVRVQLFDEIHCAVLKVLVDSEADGGKVRITLPEVDEEESDDEDDEDAEESEEEEPEPEPKPVGRATRSSLAKLEAERLAAEAAAAEEEELLAELATRPRAEELLEDYDWIERLRKRDFPNGGWERIMVGLFHQLSKDERRSKICEEFLLLLVPPDEEPTQETVRRNVAELDVNCRVRILQLICMLTMETKAVRGYMEDCSETMTKYRKDKIEWQRQRKQVTEELRQLNDQRKQILPDVTPSQPGSPARPEDDSKLEEADDTQMEKDEDADEEDDAQARRKRRRSDKQRKREEEQGRKNKEKEKEKAQKEVSRVPPGQVKQFNKLLKEIQKKEQTLKECEEEIATIENDLREADCPRTRVLGKDRFWNRYYWFERNGMPYAGLPDSSTAAAEYANGCIWVQGPDDLEREGYIEVSPELQNEYKDKFNMTIPERKAMEEGETSVFTAWQWGYISEPEQLDALIKWLDPRGYNELRLRKELVAFKDKIATHMENRKRYLESSDEIEVKEEKKRASTRIREKTPDVPNYRCLQWENTMALEDIGHLHSEPPPPPRVPIVTNNRSKTMAETEAKVKLYWLDQSRAQRIVWLLEELKVPYDVELFFRTKEFLAPPELEKIHPLGKSPVVSVTPPGEGTAPIVLAESAHITNYLCTHLPGGQRLLPRQWKDGMEGKIGGETDEWLKYQYYLHYSEGTLMPILVMTLIIGRLKSTQVPFLVRPITSSVANRIFASYIFPNARKNLAMIEQHLGESGGRYLLGDSLTAADILMSFPLIAGGGRFDSMGSWEGGSWGAQFPRTKAYVDMLEAEDGYKRSVEKIKEFGGGAKASLLPAFAAAHQRQTQALYSTLTEALAAAAAAQGHASRKQRGVAQSPRRKRPLDSAVALFNDVVKPGSATSETQRSSPDEWAVAGRLKALEEATAVTSEKLRRFEDEIWPELDAFRGQMPKHLHTATANFLRTSYEALMQSPDLGSSVLLAQMLARTGNLDLGIRNGIVLNLCHAVISGEKPHRERMNLLRQLNHMWEHISQLRRRSQVGKALRYILPTHEEILTDMAKYRDQDGQPIGQKQPASQVLAALFPQFFHEQSHKLVTGLLATLAVLSETSAEHLTIRSEAAILLDRLDVAFKLTEVFDTDVVDAFSGFKAFPETKLSEVENYILKQWEHVPAIFNQDVGWRQKLRDYRKSNTGTPKGLESFRIRLNAMYRARNAGAASRLWLEFQGHLAKHPESLKQMQDDSELLDYWVFFWCAVRRPNKLQETLALMQEIGAQPTIKTYTAMMHGWKMCKDINKIEALWQKLVDSGMTMDGIIWTERISALVELGKTQAGIQALGEMLAQWKAAHAKNPNTRTPKPSTEVINAVFKCLVPTDPDAARAVLSWAGQEGIQPNVRTFNILLRDSFKKNNYDDVQSILKTMQDSGTEPDAATFTIMLENILGNMHNAPAADQIEAVDHILHDIQLAGVKANPETYGKMLYAVAALPQAEPAIAAIQARMRKNGFAVTPHMITILIQRALDQPRPDIRPVRALLREHQLTHVRQGDQTLWERVMSAYAVTGNVDDALKVFGDLAEAGRPVSSLACLKDLLAALLSAGRADDAGTVVSMVLQNKLKSTEKPDDRYWRHHFWHLARHHGLIDPAVVQEGGGQ
ncbi:Imitation switch two complex protein 1 [Paramyrothecium foliicola]|nr:Imitation switch two complex protein 1 [Paramyrothecium foliicola]